MPRFMAPIACHFVSTVRCSEQRDSNPCSTAHRFGHLLVTPQSLDTEADGLKLCAHLVELLNITPCSDKVLRHDFACVLFAIVKAVYRILCGLPRTVCPAFALFLISAMSFFSLCSSFARSRSSSRCALVSAR